MRLKKVRLEKIWDGVTIQKNKFYNKLININKKIKCEKLFRKDQKYDYVIQIEHNTKKIIPFEGSAIFLHITTNYKPTLGCIAINKNDMRILLKLLKRRTFIKIS